MWQIIINGPGYFDTAYELPEGITSLGRADENDIVLSGDMVSRKHARIHVSGDRIEFEDLGSRNGSKVNGDPLVGMLALKVGDSVGVGENNLSVRRPSVGERGAGGTAGGSASNVRRFGGGNIADAVLLSKELKDSYVLQALDNVLPFEEATTAPVPAPATPIAYESLLVLYKLAEKLATAPSLAAFLEQTMDLVMARVEATTAVVLLRHESGIYSPAAVRHRGKLERGEVPVSDAVVDEALRKGVALAVADVREDLRFAQRESVILYDAAQVLCIPVGTEPFAGVLYLNRAARAPGELGALLDLCTAVAQLIATGVAKFTVQEKVAPKDRLRELLERAHPPELAARTLSRLGPTPRLPTPLEEHSATALCADLAGFTALGQTVPSARLGELLAAFYQRMTAGIFRHEGTVLSFSGDAVVALFGGPDERGDDALRAVRAALALKAEWDEARKTLVPLLANGTANGAGNGADNGAAGAIRLRIGLSSGQVWTGIVGFGARLDYTALGEPVNAACWLSGIAAPGQILISGKTLAAVGARFDVHPLGERLLRTGREKVPVFEVLGEDLPSGIEAGQAEGPEPKRAP